MGFPSRRSLSIIITSEDGLLDLSKCLKNSFKLKEQATWRASQGRCRCRTGSGAPWQPAPVISSHPASASFTAACASNLLRFAKSWI